MRLDGLKDAVMSNGEGHGVEADKTLGVPNGANMKVEPDNASSLGNVTLSHGVNVMCRVDPKLLRAGSVTGDIIRVGDGLPGAGEKFASRIAKECTKSPVASSKATISSNQGHWRGSLVKQDVRPVGIQFVKGWHVMVRQGQAGQGWRRYAG